MDLGLRGKKAAITGSSQGIGHAIAKSLVEEGCNVALSARNKDRLDQAVEEFDKHAKKQFEQCKWYQNVKHEPEGWTKVPMKQRESSGGQMHYLMGRTSPFHCELMISKDRQRILMAVYFGPYTSNGRNSLGTGQGGAQASVFDFLCAMTCASAQPKPAPTGTLTTRMKAPSNSSKLYIYVCLVYKSTLYTVQTLT